jgi:hypothetical protein
MPVISKSFTSRLSVVRAPFERRSTVVAAVRSRPFTGLLTSADENALRTLLFPDPFAPTNTVNGATSNSACATHLKFSIAM